MLLPAEQENALLSEQNKALSFITKRIEEGECILIIGPDISVGENDQSVNELLKSYLDKNFNNPLKYYSDDEFFSFLSDAEKDFALSDIKSFYDELTPNEILKKIADIPFHLILSVSPDHLLKKAFDENKASYNTDYCFDFYNKEHNLPKIKKFSRQKPLVYNLFGDIDSDGSLVFTYDDLFEYFTAVFGKFELPKEIQTELAAPRLILLLGIRFDKWYFKLLLRILRLHKSNYNHAADKIRNLQSAIKNFYAEEFKVKFLNCDETDIIGYVYNECKTKNMLRSQSTANNAGKPEIFVSYGWEKDSEDMVDGIAEVLADKGFSVKKDKIALGYKGNIKEFMNSIGKGKYIVVIISDKYLKSENCMYEMMEIKKHDNIYNRIFPVVMSDAKIYDEIDRIDYLNYWDNKVEELNTKARTIKNLVGIKQVSEKIDQYNDIRRIIDEMTDMLRNMNTLTPDMHQDSNFSELTLALEKQMRKDV